jgi:hypothetical protein
VSGGQEIEFHEIEIILFVSVLNLQIPSINIEIFLSFRRRTSGPLVRQLANVLHRLLGDLRLQRRKRVVRLALPLRQKIIRFNLIRMILQFLKTTLMFIFYGMKYHVYNFFCKYLLQMGHYQLLEICLLKNQYFKLIFK